MAVISVDKMWSRFTSDINPEAGSANEAYQVVFDVNTSLADIYNATPAYGASFTDLPDMKLVKKKQNRVSPIMDIIEVEYTGQGLEQVGGTKVDISWTDTETDEAIDEDWNGNPIVTANNEAISNITMKIADQVLTVKRRFLFFSPWLTHAYRHSTNSDVFQNYPAGTGRMIAFNAVFAANDEWDVTAQIQFRYPYRTTAARAWWARVRHEGYYVRDTVGGPIRRALDEKGEPMVKPVLLDSDGLQVTDPANAEWLEFQRYGSLPYNALGLI